MRGVRVGKCVHLEFVTVSEPAADERVELRPARPIHNHCISADDFVVRLQRDNEREVEKTTS